MRAEIEVAFNQTQTSVNFLDVDIDMQIAHDIILWCDIFIRENCRGSMICFHYDFNSNASFTFFLNKIQ